MNFKHNFVQLVYEQLTALSSDVQPTARSVFDAMNSLSIKDKRGIWVKMAKRVDCEAKEILNFYHNSFVKQFFTSPLPFKEDLEHLISNSSYQTDEIFKKFVELHPNEQFNQRLTKQFISILMLRMNIHKPDKKQQKAEKKEKQPELDLDNFIKQLNVVAGSRTPSTDVKESKTPEIDFIKELQMLL
uniref:Uncharacterized protein n=1 Tax=Trepomonas sp. PC1 TaxID=1076344 RepID=A0A146K831_9EUKA|eukprot:JAP92528.1 Hypothetical protein TPC1_15498 [Trepomonas sp. PC1]